MLEWVLVMTLMNTNSSGTAAVAIDMVTRDSCVKALEAGPGNRWCISRETGEVIRAGRRN